MTRRAMALLIILVVLLSLIALELAYQLHLPETAWRAVYLITSLGVLFAHLGIALALFLDAHKRDETLFGVPPFVWGCVGAVLGVLAIFAYWLANCWLLPRANGTTVGPDDAAPAEGAP